MGSGVLRDDDSLRSSCNVQNQRKLSGIELGPGPEAGVKNGQITHLGFLGLSERASFELWSQAANFVT